MFIQTINIPTTKRTLSIYLNSNCWFFVVFFSRLHSPPPPLSLCLSLSFRFVCKHNKYRFDIDCNYFWIKSLIWKYFRIWQNENHKAQNRRINIWFRFEINEFLMVLFCKISVSFVIRPHFHISIDIVYNFCLLLLSIWGQFKYY